MSRTLKNTLVSRRNFLSRTAMATAAAAIAGRAQWTGAQDESPRTDYRFVDIHTHFGQPWGQRAPLDARGLLRWMDTHGIERAAVLPLVSPESWDHPITTDYVLRETADHRDRLIPFCAIDPRTDNLGSYDAKRRLLERYKEAGARGFGEHKTGVAIDDPRNIELFRACADLDLPILFHLDNQRNTDKPGLPGLDSVLTEIPNGVFIGHAQGWWASISGDVTQEQLQRYPEQPVAPGGAIDALMDKHPNLYGDLSAGSGANALLRDPAFGREFLIRRADRLLFGSDYLMPGQPVPQLTIFDQFDLPDDVQAKIYRDNARRILKLR